MANGRRRDLFITILRRRFIIYGNDFITTSWQYHHFLFDRAPSNVIYRWKLQLIKYKKMWLWLITKNVLFNLILSRWICCHHNKCPWLREKAMQSRGKKVTKRVSHVYYVARWMIRILLKEVVWKTAELSTFLWQYLFLFEPPSCSFFLTKDTIFCQICSVYYNLCRGLNDDDRAPTWLLWSWPMKTSLKDQKRREGSLPISATFQAH